MAAAATFTVTTSATGAKATGNQTLSFSIANFDPPGAAPDQLESIQEELMDTGVNGRRWRQIYQQFTPFKLLTTADATSYDLAIAARRDYQNAKGSIGRLQVTIAGVNYSFVSVKVTDVIPSLHAGFLTGAAATVGSSAIIYGTWSMVLADTTKAGVS